MELPENPDKLNNFLVSRRAREVSQVLADAARVARFSSRARSAAQGSGYIARRGDKLLRFFKIASLILIIIIPNIISIIYFGMIASNQYLSEAKFTVSSGAIPKMDGLGSVTGLPPMTIFQDSNIIINYIESRTLVDLLDREINLRQRYGSEKIDWWSRFNKQKSAEKLLDYWRDHVKATITAPAGIIRLEVRAFSSKEAREISEVIIGKCEKLVNSLNDKIRYDTIALAEVELKRSSEILRDIRIKVESVRNQQGIINTTEASSSLTKILVDLETQLLKVKNDYETERKYVDETAPQLRVLKSKIDTIKKQILTIEQKITRKDEINQISEEDDNRENVLSKKITNLSQVELEQKIAETSYGNAITTLEMARRISEKKMIYLHNITEPVMAEEPTYPYRKIDIILILIATNILNLIINKVSFFIRDHLA